MRNLVLAGMKPDICFGFCADTCRSLYNGLNAGLQRQMCFASVRLGMYEPVKTKYQQILKGSLKANSFNTSF